MRKTALLTGAAGLFLMTAPAIAQDGTAPQTPPAATPPAQEATAPTLTLQPGMTVRGGDGDLGTLVGARTADGRQQLVVQGADGQVRAVPIDGIRQDGDVVVVDFTLEQFGTAEAVVAPPAPMPAPTEPPVEPVEPVDEAAPPPMEPPAPTPPTLPPEAATQPPANPSAPVPGEGVTPDPNEPEA